MSCLHFFALGNLRLFWLLVFGETYLYNFTDFALHVLLVLVQVWEIDKHFPLLSIYLVLELGQVEL